MAEHIIWHVFQQKVVQDKKKATNLKKQKQLKSALYHRQIFQNSWLASSHWRVSRLGSSNCSSPFYAGRSIRRNNWLQKIVAHWPPLKTTLRNDQRIATDTLLNALPITVGQWPSLVSCRFYETGITMGWDDHWPLIAVIQATVRQTFVVITEVLFF